MHSHCLHETNSVNFAMRNELVLEATCVSKTAGGEHQRTHTSHPGPFNDFKSVFAELATQQVHTYIYQGYPQIQFCRTDRVALHPSSF
mmetsp:Transcript_16090/g.32594  ORF Transcript_16090/g.32594 Transcript_16090/m.32594 type:complete len:88 (+) Transcript_16090:299-562(+)